MTIAANRFTYLDQEATLISSDFLKASNSAVLNLAEAIIAPQNVIDFINAGLQASGLSAFVNDTLGSAISDVIRTGQGVVSGVMDLTGLSANQVNALLANMYTNPSAASIIGRLSSDVVSNIAGTVINTASGLANTAMGVVNSDLTGITNAVSSVTGVPLVAPAFNQINIAAGISGLTVAAENAGIPGAFGALTGGIAPITAGISSVTAMQTLINNGNIVGALNVMNASVGLSLNSIVPNIGNTIATAVATTTQGISAGLIGTLNSALPSLLLSPTDGIPSVSNVISNAATNIANTAIISASNVVSGTIAQTTSVVSNSINNVVGQATASAANAVSTPLNSLAASMQATTLAANIYTAGNLNTIPQASSDFLTTALLVTP